MQGILMRKGLVVFQFTLSIVLIAGTLVISNQIDYLRSAKLGFDDNQLVVVPLQDSTLRAQYETLTQELTRHPDVLHAAAVSNVPGGRFNQNSIRWVNDEDLVDASEWYVDYDVIESLGMEIVAGRGFSRDFPGDVGTAFLLNETAAQRFNWDTAIDKEVTWYADPDSIRGRVVGVVKDFNFASLHQTVAPMIVQLSDHGFNYMLVKIRAERIPATLTFLEQQWATFAPERRFTYSFLNDDFDALYQAEERLGIIIGVFAVLAIFVACLGLFGLATFTAEQRTKEIGVRKVMGATTAQVVLLLSQDFARLVVVALVLAAPFAYLAMNQWLDHFAYRIAISGWVFVLAGLAALFVALLSVSYQAVKAALTDPAECLRYE